MRRVDATWFVIEAHNGLGTVRSRPTVRGIPGALSRLVAA